MKINDVIIKEAGFADAYAMRNAPGGPPPIQTTKPGSSASEMGKAYADYYAAGQKGPAALASWPTTAAEIKAFQKANGLKVDGVIGKNTMAALQKAGVTPPEGFKPVATKTSKASTKAGEKTAADPTKDPYDPNKDPNVQMTPQSAIQTAQSDADKKAAIGGNQPPQAAASTPAPVNTAAPATQGGYAQSATTPWGGKVDQNKAMADFQKLAGITPTVNNQSSSYNQPPAKEPPPAKELPPGLASATTPQGSAEQPAGQAAQPQVNPDGTGSGVNPDTGLDTTPKKVAGTTNVTTGSDDEMAWRQKNPQWAMTGQQYPGPGNWDPKTGRSKKDLEAGQKNWNAIKGFFGGNKTAPAQESADLAILKKLSGL